MPHIQLLHGASEVGGDEVERDGAGGCVRDGADEEGKDVFELESNHSLEVVLHTAAWRRLHGPFERHMRLEKLRRASKDRENHTLAGDRDKPEEFERDKIRNGGERIELGCVDR